MSSSTAHIISHSHWDREWYLPFESHRVRLVNLLDTLIDLMESQTDFKSFHLDGQTIVLDDYLEVRPENRKRLGRLLREGRFQLGPWYILQDEFLVSGEATVRNLIEGHRACREWGTPVCAVGYFPDAFGSIGQAPQILRQVGINVAVFGRGVKPTGANNEVSEISGYESPHSEMEWEGPDGSRVLGILFANWYHNAMEVPTDPIKAEPFWDSALAQARRYASTDQLLFLNGCDHQPAQTNLVQALEVAADLFPDVEFIHSDFPTYVRSLEQRLPRQLQRIHGELRSQNTDGWWTLVNTASSRVPIKQANQRCQTTLERVAEPLAVFAWMSGAPYPHHLLRHSWKLLMQNHPHDSICGCSTDSVHDEMMSRFSRSLTVAQDVVERAARWVAGQIDSSDFPTDSIPFVVFNTTPWDRSGSVTVELDWLREPLIYGQQEESFRSLSSRSLPVGGLVDKTGAKLPFVHEDLGVVFGYDLPDDRFRQPYLSRRVRITLATESVPAYGYRSLAWVPNLSTELQVSKTLDYVDLPILENTFLIVRLAVDGSFTLIDKATGRSFPGLGNYEDTGDIGNEYVFVEAAGNSRMSTAGLPAQIRLVRQNHVETVAEVIHRLEIPVSASTDLESERKRLTPPNQRHAGRSIETGFINIITVLSLGSHDRHLSVSTTINNRMKDHRLRVLIPTGIRSSDHFVDSVFEVATRPNRPTPAWKNPSFCHHQSAFVGLEDEVGGLLVGNRGLSEYEVLGEEKRTVAVTLLRCIGELGDWGYFPTPDAQCLGTHTLVWSIHPFSGPEGRLSAQASAYQTLVPWTACQVPVGAGTLPAEHRFVRWDGLGMAPTALKLAEESPYLLIRAFNMSSRSTTFAAWAEGVLGSTVRVDLLERKMDEPGPRPDGSLPVGPAQILTVLLESR